MNSFLSDNKYCLLRAFFRFSILFIATMLLLACSSRSQQVIMPKFELADAGFAKGIRKTENTLIPLTPTNTFTTKDTAIISYVKIANLSGEHKVKWKWYDPTGRLHFISKEYTFKTSKDKYVEEALAFNKISITGENAESLKGEWEVYILYDGRLLTSMTFKILSDVFEDVAYDVDLNIPETKMDNPDGIAVVIGNRHYDHPDIPDVKYAVNDAEVVKKYLINTLGYKEENIIFETNISKAKFEILFGISGNHKGKLYSYVRPGQSDVLIYYSGHGAPDANSQKGFFLPVDSDPTSIAFNGYPLDLFYENLSKINAGTLTVVLDSCFSGGTSSGDWIITKASPALIQVNNPMIYQTNAVVLSSSTNNQISSWYEEKGHGLFTYFFLKGISGASDNNEDGQITYTELYDYVSNKSKGVPYWAKRLHGGRVQMPTIEGKMIDHVFVTFQ